MKCIVNRTAVQQCNYDSSSTTEWNLTVFNAFRLQTQAGNRRTAMCDTVPSFIYNSIIIFTLVLLRACRCNFRFIIIVLSIAAYTATTLIDLEERKRVTN